MTRAELLQSPYYWCGKIQVAIYEKAMEFMSSHNYNRKALAQYLGVSNGYVTQILSGDYNFSIEKLCELSLKLGVVPSFEFKPISHVLFTDTRTLVLKQSKTLMPELEISNFKFISAA